MLLGRRTHQVELCPPLAGPHFGLMYFIVRTGIALWSIALPVIMDTLTFVVAGIVMMSFLVIHLVIGVLMAPNTRGKTLTEIEEERYGHIVEDDRSFLEKTN